MNLQEHDKNIFSDHNYEDEADISHQKKVRRLLEEHLEKKRLKDEFKDDFDELGADFDWELLDK